MYKFIVTVINTKTLALEFQGIMEAYSQHDILLEMNKNYPQFHVFDCPNPFEFRCYITVIN